MPAIGSVFLFPTAFCVLKKLARNAKQHLAPSQYEYLN